MEKNFPTPHYFRKTIQVLAAICILDKWWRHNVRMLRYDIIHWINSWSKSCFRYGTRVQMSRSRHGRCTDASKLNWILPVLPCFLTVTAFRRSWSRFTHHLPSLIVPPSRRRSGSTAQVASKSKSESALHLWMTRTVTQGTRAGRSEFQAVLMMMTFFCCVVSISILISAKARPTNARLMGHWSY